MKISKNKNNNSGFTIIELVVVIAALSALASFSIPSFLNSMKKNKDDTDFRLVKLSYETRDEQCLCCNIKQTDIITENELAFAIYDMP